MAIDNEPTYRIVLQTERDLTLQELQEYVAASPFPFNLRQYLRAAGSGEPLIATSRDVKTTIRVRRTDG